MNLPTLLRSIVWALIGLCLWHPVSWASNQIQGLRVTPSPSNTRLVFDLSAPPEYTYFSLKNPNRLVIDFKDTQKNIDFSAVENTSQLIRKVRTSSPKHKSGTRVVIELNQAISPDLFALAPIPPYQHRLVVDFKGEFSESVIKDANSTPHDRDIIIAIDAGHGGEDPGSIGYSGSFEKHVTLSIAKRLKGLIDAEPGLKAILTRSGDYYIHPNKRPGIARENKADLFVSIHADAFKTPQPRGASVWTLSTRRANTELGRWMEQREKHSELLGGAAEVIQDTANERYLTQALLDMSMDHSLSTSFDLSRELIKTLSRVTKMHKKAPQSASFAVLTSPDIPSVLVETGFISNQQEEKNLNWSTYRQQLAKALFDAIKVYFEKVPPDGTLWAQQRFNNRTHKVRSGDSLSVLAQRYNTSVIDIKVANKLTSDVVRVGQVLTIPRT